MSMEYPYSAARWAKRTPDQLVPIKRELEVGKFFRIESSFSTEGNHENINPTRYYVNSQLAQGVLRASRVDDTNLPASIILHRVSKAGAGPEQERDQKLIQLTASRRVDIPNALRQYRGAVVATPYGYLQINETQGDQEIPTGTYTITDDFGSKNAEQTLQAIREQGLKVDPKLIAQIILNVGSTLAVSHALGFVHRDVKPSNIQLRDLYPGSNYPADYAALTDWETAYIKGGKAEDFQWGCGTLNFMAPEQHLEQSANTHYTSSLMDIHAFGMTIYALLGGELPDFMDALAEAGMAGTPLDPKKSWLPEEEVERVCIEAGLPDLKKVILKATVFDAQKRYQSVKEMLLDSLSTLSLNYEPNSLGNYLAQLPEPTV